MKRIILIIIFSLFWIFSFVYGKFLNGKFLINLSWKNLKEKQILSWKNLSWYNLSVKKKAEAINKFIEREKKMIQQIYKNWAFMLLLDLDNARKQIENMANEFHNLQKQIDQLSKKKKRIDENYYEILSGVKSIIKQMKSTQQNLKNKLVKIRIYSLKIVQLRKEIKKLRSDINFVKKKLAEYTSLFYRVNNQISSDWLTTDDLKLIFLSNDNISHLLSKQDILKLLNIRLKELLKLLEIKDKKLTRYINAVNILRQKYKEEVNEYQRQLDILQEQKKYLLFLLRYLRVDKKEIDKKFYELINSKKSLKRQLLNLILLTKRKIDKIKLWTGIDIRLLLKTPEKPDSDRFLSWPVLPVKKISTYFDDEWYLKKYGVLHKAIDIAIPQWSPVYAPANGIVYKVFDHDWPYLNRLILIHKYWYITVYLHLYKIFVKPGQFVKRWQIIWISGGIPWTRWAWFLSEWPHLHFEVIKNWQWVDPLKYLDLSIIDFSYKKLPEKYWLKYFKDRLSRNIDLSKVKYMSGHTLLERRINFLKKYWSWPYKNINLWQQAASGFNIDIDLGICIWYAETWLWKHFAKNSKWNVWNVWNNDRWDRRWFPNPLAWARAIFKVLNNKYLKNIWTVDKLSRYWSNKGPIYASDSINWQRNVIKCLTMIKWYRVPEDYPFRIVKYKIWR